MNTDLRTLEAVAAKGRLLGAGHGLSLRVRASGRLVLGHGHPYRFVLRCDARGPEQPRRPQPGPFRPVQGPLHPGAVPDLGSARLFPGGGIGPVPQHPGPPIRACGDAACEGCGYVHGLPGAGDLRSSGNGAGRQDGPRRITGSMRSWETVKWRKARCGRPS